MLHFLKLYISLAAEVDWSSRSAQSNAFRLVSAFRSVGHRHADINPVPYAKEVNREE
jgi:2-oxoglutarate dehydrogenase complex dehydrogenase (E1) component-like enzyme